MTSPSLTLCFRKTEARLNVEGARFFKAIAMTLAEVNLNSIDDIEHTCLFSVLAKENVIT